MCLKSKRVFLALAAGVFLSMACKMTFSEKAPPLDPRYSLTFNFGGVQTGTRIERDFIFVNPGESVLEVDKVSSSCGCTVLSNHIDKIQPGDSATFPVG